MTKYLVKQHDAADCAAACLATVCLYYKKRYIYYKIKRFIRNGY
ncbi:cysteine peptidase family C39 domain-containing protein [Bacillus paranthracis]